MPGGGKRSKIKAFDPFSNDKAKKAAYFGPKNGGRTFNQPVTKKSQQISWSERQFSAQLAAADPNKPKPKAPRGLTTPKPERDSDRKGKSKRKGVKSVGDDSDTAAAGSDDDSNPRPQKRSKGDGAAAAEATDAKEPNRHEKAAAPPKYTTKIREGESFASYQKRIVAEKDTYLRADAKQSNQKKISDGRKAFLSKKKDRLKPKEETEMVAPDGSIRPIKEFAANETIEFGDIADRPPIFTVLPKQKQKVAGAIALAAELKQFSTALAAAELKQKKAAAKLNAANDSDGDEGGGGRGSDSDGAAAMPAPAPVLSMSAGAAATLSNKIAPVLSKNNRKNKNKLQSQKLRRAAAAAAADDEDAASTVARERKRQTALAEKQRRAAMTAAERETEQLRAAAVNAYKQSKFDARTKALNAAGVAFGVSAAQRERDADAAKRERLSASINPSNDPEIAADQEREALASSGKGKRSVAGALAVAIKKRSLQTDGSALLSNL